MDDRLLAGKFVEVRSSQLNKCDRLRYNHVLTLDDPLHSIGELRFLAVGYSEQNNLLAVVYTERNNDIRVISARPVPRKMYEQDF